jgi:hypothetical protein
MNTKPILSNWSQFAKMSMLSLLLTAAIPIAAKADFAVGSTSTQPIVTVVRQDFPAATGWRITSKGGIYSPETAKDLQQFFSTITGAINSMNFLNGTSWSTTDNVDMSIWGRLKATSTIPGFVHVSALKNTLFRLTNLNVATIKDTAMVNPAAFGLAFEYGNFGPKVNKTAPYAAGQIYLFKTARSVAKYGAIRVVKSGGSEAIIEVIVQK